MTNEEIIAALEALYAELPTIDCQGLCWNSCGPIEMSTAERERIEAAGISMPMLTHDRTVRWQRGEPLHCPALDRLRRCTVYEIRPLICRVWGNGRGELACPWGCERQGPRLKIEEIMALMIRAYELGGDDRSETSWSDIDQRILSDPMVKKLLVRYIAGDFSVSDQLISAGRQALARLKSSEPNGPLP